MKGKSQRNIKQTIKALRKIIDAPDVDPVVARMAYFCETSLRWSTEDTKGWQRPEVDLIEEVSLLKKQLNIE